MCNNEEFETQHIKKRERMRKYQKIPRSVNFENIIVIPLQWTVYDYSQVKSDVNLTLLNVQSYRYKEMVLIDYLSEYNKIIVVTETWLRNSDRDKIWIDASKLSENGHKTYASNRLERWVGGIALIYNMNMRTIKVMEGKGSKVVDLGLIALYHPQYTCASHITKTVCLDEFTVSAAVILLKHNNIILLGDINLLINDQDDPDVCMFLDIINVMGLMQHVSSLTQRGGNTLDAIMTESHSEIKIVITIQAPSYLITESFNQGSK